MKGKKKLLALLLAMVMVLSLGASVFATSTTTSITITGATKDQTYSVYKVFDLDYGTANDAYAYSYTTADAANDNFLKAVQNGYTPSGGSLIASPFTATASSVSNVYTITSNDNSTETKTIAFLNALYKDNLLGTAVASETATGDSLTFSNLVYGYYYITTTTGSAVIIESTNPTVEVADKNEVPVVEKTVQEDAASDSQWGSENSAEIGDTINYSTEIILKRGSQNIVLHDQMDAGLTLDTSTIKVYAEGGTTEIDTKYYTIKTSGFSDSCDFEISFTDAFYTYFYALTNPNMKMIIKYSAQLNEDAEIAAEATLNTNDNETWISYGANGNITTTHDTTQTYTYAFKVYKYYNKTEDGNTTKEPLSGAKFIIGQTLNKGTNQETVKYAKFTTAGLFDGWVNSADQATELESGPNGEISISGMDLDSYFLRETVAPEGGYNLLTEDVGFTIESKDTSDLTKGYQITSGGKTSTISVYQVDVENKTGSELPNTGGMGTTIIYAVSGCLAVGALILLVVKKRMRNYQE